MLRMGRTAVVAAAGSRMVAAEQGLAVVVHNSEVVVVAGTAAREGLADIAAAWLEPLPLEG